MSEKTSPPPVTADELARWNKLRGMGYTSAVGEYTPDEFWRVVNELARLMAERDELVAALRAAEKDLTYAEGTNVLSYETAALVRAVLAPQGGPQ